MNNARTRRLTATFCALTIVTSSVLLCACRRAAGPEAAAPAPPPPADDNVVLISVDTLRADRLNCYGYEARKTSPHIDAFAADAILFENHAAASPWTTPTHMSLFTSLYPCQHGLTQPFGDLMDNLLSGGQFNKLPEERVTLAEILKDNGYATGAFTAGAAVDPKIGFGQGFIVYDTSMYKLGEANMEEMFGWLDRNSLGKFFLFWHNFEVHAPYLEADFLEDVLPSETAAQIRPGLEEIKKGLIEFNPNVAERQKFKDQMTTLLGRHGALTRDVCETLYTGGVLSFDRWFGQFVQYLRDKDLYDNTMIILTSDHGEEFGDRDPETFYGGHGHTLYEEIIRVPLIIKLPRQQYAGTRISANVRTIDIMPTILDVLRRAPSRHDMKGVTLRAIWEGAEADSSRVALSESLIEPQEQKSIRVDQYKLIVTVDSETVAEHGRCYLPDEPAAVELYDLQADPLEKNNLLAGDPEQRLRDLASSFETSLRDRLSEEEGEADQVDLDYETLERLRQMGYIQD
ncbi:MAG: sulfatase [Phycisphaerales bacterium]|nr:MAG: sulfatase [Phycisphaerales bacterium]